MPWIHRHRSVLGGLFALAVVGVTFGVVLPRIADYGEVWEAIRGLDAIWIAALLGATVLNIVTYAPPWMAALPGLRLRQALPFTQASTAVTYVLPGGGFVGMAGSFALLRSWGFGSAEVTRAVTLTGVWNQLTNLLLPTIAVGLLAAEAETDAGIVVLAFVGAAIFGVVVLAFSLVLWRRELARAIGELGAATVSRCLVLVRRGPVRWGGASFVRFRDSTIDLLRRRWLALSAAAVVGNLAVFVVLLVAVRAVGIGASDVTWIEIFAAWAVARVIGLVPFTPGGIGVVEVGLTGAFVGFGGANAPVVAAVLIYRALTVVPTLVLGSLTMLVWRRLNPTVSGAGDDEPALNPQTTRERAESQDGDVQRPAG